MVAHASLLLRGWLWGQRSRSFWQRWSCHTHTDIYLYIYIYTCVCVWIYTYFFRYDNTSNIYIYMYIYIYVSVYTFDTRSLESTYTSTCTPFQYAEIEQRPSETLGIRPPWEALEHRLSCKQDSWATHALQSVTASPVSQLKGSHFKSELSS